MKITIYELLGLIKDGKAPKKIKYCGCIYEWDEESKFYLTQKKSYKVFLGGNKGDINILFNAFNENVEILEEVEDKGYEGIEEITLDDWAEITYSSNWGLLTHDFNLNSNTYTDKINALIRNQKKIIERLDNGK